MRWIFIILGALALLVALVCVIGALLPRHHTASRTAHFQAKPEAVWAVISDPSHFKEWRTELKDVQVIDGKSWREVDSHGHAIPYEAVESVPPRRFVTRIADRNLPFGGTWTQEIAPDGEGSRLTVTEDGEIYNVVFRFVSRFILGYTGTIDAYLRNLDRRLSAAP